jgi:hypothetical protein
LLPLVLNLFFFLPRLIFLSFFLTLLPSFSLASLRLLFTFSLFPSFFIAVLFYLI